LGGFSHIHLDAGTQRLLAAVSDEVLPSVGDTLDILVPSARAHLFDAEGLTVSLPYSKAVTGAGRG
jgi:hypothetical protein